MCNGFLTLGIRCGPATKSRVGMNRRSSWKGNPETVS
jgi:hypothetical protein